MNRRLAQATLATAIASLASASAAVAQPTVGLTLRGSASVAEFRDTGTGPFSTADILTVQQTVEGATEVYRFTNNVAMGTTTPGPCVPVNAPTSTIWDCSVSAGVGVDVVLGDAPAAANPQSVTFTGFSVAQVNTASGGPTPDQFTGGVEVDTFTGNGGADSFDGGAGASVDTVDYTGQTQPVLAAISGSPTSGVGGAAEGDTITPSIEAITGGSGADVLTGSSSGLSTTKNNILSGAGGNDTLNGLDGADTLNGGTENDTLNGGDGGDTLNGDAGDDVLAGGLESTPAVDELNGAAGSDTADFANDGRTAGITANLGGSPQTFLGGGADNDRADSTSETIENVTGTPFADTVSGDEFANIVHGGPGDDDFTGGLGGDTFFGEAGVDRFRYTDGQHDASGAANAISLDDAANDGLSGENDNIRSDVEEVFGGSADDSFVGSAAKNDFRGGAGVNSVSFAGRSENITASVFGGGPEGDVYSGMSSLTGGNGNDVLSGDAAPNNLAGGPGDDVLRGGLGADVLDGGTGTNTADYSQEDRSGQPSPGVDVDLTLGRENFHGTATQEDMLVVNSSVATIQNAVGTAADDVLSGNGDGNVLIALAGADQLKGLFGDDTLAPGSSSGGADGADVVDGGNGANDTVSYGDRTSAVTVTLDGASDDGAPGEGDTVTATVENVVTGSGDDTITANPDPAVVVANSFDGGGGNDTITSLGGNDVITGGGGADSVSAGDGDDVLKLVDTISDIAGCGAGNDTADADDIDVMNSDCETVNRFATPSPATPAPAPGPAGTLTVTNPKAAEGNAATKPFVFTVKLSGAQVAAVAVPYQTADLTAKAGSDYSATAGTLTFAPGETTKTVTVLVKGDTTIEKDEKFGLVMSKPTGNAKLTAVNDGVGTIVNDDNAPAVKKKTPGLSFSVTPRRDRSRPYAFVVIGKLKRPKGVSSAKGCKGKVEVKLRRGRKTLRTRKGFVDPQCSFTVPVSTRTRGSLRVQVRFTGNRALKAKTARTRRVRAG